ncbi:MAG: hypothetical protein KKF66_07790 [Actinobacteria bacterium]|nr:hypothetical protein [Actinomycetota bacterium]
MDKEPIDKKVPNLARKLYWRERRRALRGRGVAREEPAPPEPTEELGAKAPEEGALVTPAEALDRVTRAAPAPADSAGWAKQDVVPSDAAGDKPAPWPHFLKASEFTGETERESEKRSVTTASISRLARKMIAREWRRALNKPSPNYGLTSLEEEAVRIREDIEQRKLREVLEEEERQKAERQVRLLAGAITDVAEYIAEYYERANEEPDPIDVTSRITRAVRDVGFLFDIQWGSDGCDIWLEPWEERRLRRQGGEKESVVYHIQIDGEMEVVLRGIYRAGGGIVETSDDGGDKEELAVVLAPGAMLLELGEGDEPELALRSRLSELGKVVGVDRDEDVWRASLEPWAEVRARRLNEPGREAGGPWVIRLDRDMVIKSCDRQVRV